MKRLSICIAIVVSVAFLILVWRKSSTEPLFSGYPELIGKPEKIVLEKFGDPEHQYKFNVPVTGTLPEYCIQIHNTYPPDNPLNANIFIRELTWKDGDYTIKVWLHRPRIKWIVLDTSRWHKSIAF